VTYAKVASALWAVGVIAGSFSARPLDAASVMSGVSLLLLGIASIVVIAWAASSHAHQPVARAGWLVLSTGLLIALAGNPGWSALAPWLFWSRFGDVNSWVTAGYVVAGIGMVVLAISVGGADDRGRTAFRALGIALGVLVIMVAALLAPGPGVPYSVGPLDVPAVWRLLIESGLMLLPMAYAVLTQLRGSEGHRARVWLWIAAASLVFAMGDVGSALLDHAGAQLYPRALWELGTIFIAAAALLAADFEGDKRVEGEGGAEEAGTPLRELYRRMRPTT
jgi:hypothetical protein